MKVRVYTDGACSENPGPGGWAMVFNFQNGCRTASGYDLATTNNRMELTAVVECLKKICRIGNVKDTFEIYSDSAYVVNAIKNQWLAKWKLNGWKTTAGDDIKNRDLWERADKYLRKAMQKKCDVSFIKIKGHAGNAFNELVDKLAKEQSMKAKGILQKEGTSE